MKGTNPSYHRRTRKRFINIYYGTLLKAILLSVILVGRILVLPEAVGIFNAFEQSKHKFVSSTFYLNSCLYSCNWAQKHNRNHFNESLIQKVKNFNVVELRLVYYLLVA